MNHLPLYAHGSINVIKILKQIQNESDKVLAKVKEAKDKDISYIPYQQSNGWLLLDIKKYDQTGNISDCLTEAKVLTNDNSFVELLVNLKSEKLVIVVDIDHKDKILSVVNRFDIVESRTIHANLYLLLVDLDVSLRKFFTGKEEELEEKMFELHKGSYKEIKEKINQDFYRGEDLTFFDLVAVQHLAEIYVKYNHAKLGPQREQVRTSIYQLRTNLVHINASNLHKIEVGGSVIDTVIIINEILNHLRGKGF